MSRGSPCGISGDAGLCARRTPKGELHDVFGSVYLVDGLPVVIYQDPVHRDDEVTDIKT